MVEFVDDETERCSLPTQSERIIWKLYEYGAMVLPALIMLGHWYVFYLFSLNTHEVLDYPKVNEFCIAWLYTSTYLIIPLVFLPATFLFRMCNLFRVPFVHFIFINVERLYYGSWFCTNEMIDSHYILIYCTICIYIVELLGAWWRNRKYLKSLPLLVISKVRCLLHSRDNAKYERIVKAMEGRKHDAA